MPARRPNILFIIADDHAPKAISAYGDTWVSTPHIDRLAVEGARLENCFCTNAICSPARATVLTGMYSHLNGVKTLADVIDQTRILTAPMMLREAGYQTAIFGKWHLGHGGASDPAGFDEWRVLRRQGSYMNPTLLSERGATEYAGYVTDVLADQALDWLQHRDPGRPFFLMLANKAPHDPFVPAERHRRLYADTAFPRPPTFDDDLSGRAQAVRLSTQRVALMLDKGHLPEAPPPGLSETQQTEWNYQCFIRNYLRCVIAIDENVGRLLDWLDGNHLSEDTLVVYTSDHGFLLAEHGWYDKRFMDDPSIRIPFLARYPAGIPVGAVLSAMALNTDVAPALLDFAGIERPESMQGRSLRPLLCGETPPDWRTSMYYRYWMHMAHFGVPAHYGIRTERYKLLHYYGQPLGCAGARDEPTIPEWELLDLQTDPNETTNHYQDPAYRHIVERLTRELSSLRADLGDEGPP